MAIGLAWPNTVAIRPESTSWANRRVQRTSQRMCSTAVCSRQKGPVSKALSSSADDTRSNTIPLIRMAPTCKLILEPTPKPTRLVRRSTTFVKICELQSSWLSVSTTILASISSERKCLQLSARVTEPAHGLPGWRNITIYLTFLPLIPPTNNSGAKSLNSCGVAVEGESAAPLPAQDRGRVFSGTGRRPVRSTTVISSTEASGPCTRSKSHELQTAQGVQFPEMDR